jgi:hypothetical protein
MLKKPTSKIEDENDGQDRKPMKAIENTPKVEDTETEKVVKHIMDNKAKRGSSVGSGVFAQSGVPGLYKAEEHQKKELTKDYEALGIENEDILDYHLNEIQEY